MSKEIGLAVQVQIWLTQVYCDGTIMKLFGLFGHIIIIMVRTLACTRWIPI